ncbi:hypothetical protein CC1G_06333 [Coprinopsis cinerea okayama7|uniref:Uncharacterized protein n=1 Tax=Coprinopsis cinerea (strain Okayama-7 / 130 / ATCC MYA-4618 / FGSC 9003) TaxID=240176 RepID=A8NTJ9_COPC7|nr:hypothetical protein CC1G_06333 [Coprinopsis cinerea okayama7\|eukprot:XP_001836248.2 hypothetical protein CC1G_06333 [Coprinopsis cinerea okayama7\
MPTATSTITTTVYTHKAPHKTSLKTVLPIPMPTNNSPTTTTLRSLYNRAARAFLHKNIGLTHTLIDSAFQLLKAPTLTHDALDEHRRKWDILRITLETTIYADPPSRDSIPEHLRSILTESPQILMSNIYGRSLALFTPVNGTTEAATPDAAYLPSAVLITLLYSTLKLDCPDVGRMMAEQWMSRRESPLLLNASEASAGSEEGGYEKVVEIYVLHILPKLEQWQYAKEFLQFEGELHEPQRELFKSQLNALHAETLAARIPRSSPTSESPSPTPRTHSPAPSASSTSSLSTTSTHTVVPSTPRGSKSSSAPQAMTALATSSSSSKASSDGTATPTPRGRHVALPNGNVHTRSETRRTNSSAASSSSVSSTGPRTILQTSSTPTSPPTILSLVKASLAPHLTTSKVTTFIILFVLFPVISWIWRIRYRRRRAAIAAALAPSNVDLVRRRLQVAGASDASLVTRLWKGSLRAVVDTVKMAGSGLV